MKKLFFLVALLFFGKITAQDQVTTSEEDYIYLTKDYPFAVENKYPVKSGYELKKIDESSFSNCKVVFYQFIETGSGQTKAFLLQRIDVEKPKKTRWYCLPINNELLMKKFTYDNSNDPLQHPFAVCLAKLLANRK